MADEVATPNPPPVAPPPAPVAPTPPPAPVEPPPVVTYKALVDLQYGEKIVKEGDTANDIPNSSVKWLLEQKLIEKEVT